MNFEAIDILSKEEVEKNYDAIIESKNYDISLISQNVAYCNCRTCAASWSCGAGGGAGGTSTYFQCYCSTYDYKTFIYDGAGTCPTPTC